MCVECVKSNQVNEEERKRERERERVRISGECTEKSEGKELGLETECVSAREN